MTGKMLRLAPGAKKSPTGHRRHPIMTQNILFGLLIQFESFDLAGNGLNASYYDRVTSVTTHSCGKILKLGPRGPERCPRWLKIAKIIFSWLLIEFESFDLAGNGLKRFLLWLSTIGHHSRMWKFGPEGSEGAQKVPNVAENVPKVTFWTIDRIWIIWFDCKWSKTVPIMIEYHWPPFTHVEIGPTRVRRCPIWPKMSQNWLFGLDRIWIIWFGCKWSKTIPIWCSNIGYIGNIGSHE